MKSLNETKTYIEKKTVDNKDLHHNFYTYN